ncbi:acyl-CoA N-acyltransferase [Ceraceosorus guamensis]|uniref:Acyl-CoA N-acyltransferase n=1 Tax=Ceraceosorus guamensis TaxID=1522189 RepID=A0A316VV14_9BASI|nr:acyl-CoA N-acyltransferase [Ceraceosorus guamensis]PWN41300.1 acyl-CoA N-acyltransferase [Ceraceosorus guamensis]
MPPTFASGPPPSSSRAAPFSSSSLVVRPAKPSDIPTLLRFIADLAKYEEAPESNHSTVELLQENIFDKGFAGALIAEIKEGGVGAEANAVGMAIYCHTFSTWTAKPSLFLEDLYVSPQARNRGAGKALFRELGAIAEREGCPRLDWNVLEWNEPSIAFYTKVLGAHKMNEWRTCRLEGEGITRLRSLGLDS